MMILTYEVNGEFVHSISGAIQDNQCIELYNDALLVAKLKGVPLSEVTMRFES